MRQEFVKMLKGFDYVGVKDNKIVPLSISEQTKLRLDYLKEKLQEKTKLYLLSGMNSFGSYYYYDGNTNEILGKITWTDISSLAMFPLHYGSKLEIIIDEDGIIGLTLINKDNNSLLTVFSNNLVDAFNRFAFEYNSLKLKKRKGYFK